MVISPSFTRQADSEHQVSKESVRTPTRAQGRIYNRVTLHSFFTFMRPVIQLVNSGVPIVQHLASRNPIVNWFSVQSADSNSLIPSFPCNPETAFAPKNLCCLKVISSNCPQYDSPDYTGVSFPIHQTSYLESCTISNVTSFRATQLLTQ